MRPNYKMLKEDLKIFGLAIAEMKENLGKVNYDKLSQSAKERYDAVFDKMLEAENHIKALSDGGNASSNELDRHWEQLKEQFTVNNNFDENAAGRMKELDEKLGKDDDARMIWSFENKFEKLNKYILKIEDKNDLEAEKEKISAYAQGVRTFSEKVKAYEHPYEYESLADVQKDIDKYSGEIAENKERLAKADEELEALGGLQISAERNSEAIGKNADDIAVNDNNIKENAASSAVVDADLAKNEEDIALNANAQKEIGDKLAANEKAVQENEKAIADAEQAKDAESERQSVEEEELNTLEDAADAFIRMHEDIIGKTKNELDASNREYDEKISAQEKNLAETVDARATAISDADKEIDGLRNQIAELNASYKANENEYAEKMGDSKNKYIGEAVRSILTSADDKGKKLSPSAAAEKELVGLMSEKDELLGLRDDIYKSIFEYGTDIVNDPDGTLKRNIGKFREITGNADVSEFGSVKDNTVLLAAVQSAIASSDMKINDLLDFDNDDKRFSGLSAEDKTRLRDGLNTYADYFREKSDLREKQIGIYKKNSELLKEIKAKEENRENLIDEYDEKIDKIKYNAVDGLGVLRNQKAGKQAECEEQIRKSEEAKTAGEKRAADLREKNDSVRRANDDRMNELMQKLDTLNAEKEKLQNEKTGLEENKDALENAGNQLELLKNEMVSAKANLEEQKAGFEAKGAELKAAKEKLEAEKTKLSRDSEKKKALLAERKDAALKINKAENAKAKVEAVGAELNKVTNQGKALNDKRAELMKDLGMENNEFKKDHMKGIADNVFNEMRGFLNEKDFGRKKNHSDSPEYKNMIDSIKNLLGHPYSDAAKPKNADELMKALDNVRNTAAKYTELKNKEWNLIPSTQRKARLDFADRLCEYATDAMGDLAKRSAEVEAYKNLAKEKFGEKVLSDDKDIVKEVNTNVKNREKANEKNADANEIHADRNLGPASN